MNTTATTATTAGAMPTNLDTSLGVAFFGFSAGAILFGITVRQAYQYYTTSTNDKLLRKLIVGAVCLLDGMHLAFSMYLVYSLILDLLGYTTGPHVLWSLKALGSTQVILIILVQGFYLLQIWRLSGNLLLAKKFAVAVQIFVIIIAILAVAVGAVFLSQLQKINVIYGFDTSFEYIVYMGFGATAIIDCATAAAMCLLLHKSSAGTIKSETVLETLIQYFIGSGLLTSFAAILCIVLYVAQPDTLLYLGMEFSVTRLYANSLLAISNGRGRLRERLDETIELRLPSGMFFGEPDSASLIGRQFKDPFSRHSEPKYAELAGSSPSSPNARGKYLGVAVVDPFSPNSETKYSPVECGAHEDKNLSRSSSRSYTV
ncbi:hypothetical protein BDN70DRAFT_884733 [Pholiota conissans]|uniref:DUF6534 domain-containing protein n=1 Tax=Pholiota conissans TaxID=109636 RepID=A0A9P5YVA2_9AGAR|nr:hypothetical protein BDN70DRAFT_884733 [Pholiota conissans]